jgi:serine/threonine protein kinase/Tol biopolymer transport system component
MPLSEGDHLGPYEILSPIGEGGMGVVYRAKDGRLGREVAIKVLGEDFSEDPDRVRRFKQEARVAGMLNHPNILAVYDLGTHEGQLYLVSELLEGDTLRTRLDAGPVPQRKALQYAQQIASGLAAAHDKGITHRDLKPENLFIVRDGSIKILDFGLAKLALPEEPYGSALTAAGKTRIGSVLGTVGYMAPEQVTGQPADARSDIFSLGVVLYEMISGRRAFQAPTAVETMAKIVRHDPPPLEAPEPVEQLVHRCLEKDPAERFQSARDLSFSLQGLATLDTSKVSQFSAQAVPKGQRSVLLWAAGIAAGLAIAVVSGHFLWTRTASSAVFHRVTYSRGTISGARFAPDGQTIVYSAQWEGRPLETFEIRPEYPESRSLNLASHLVSVSAAGELAVLREPQLGSLSQWSGTLATSPMGATAPRDLVEHVGDADYAPDGRMAVVTRIEGGTKNRLEFPPGKVLYEGYWMSHVRVSPQGDRIAFLDHTVPFDSGGSVVVVDANGKKTELSTGWTGLQGLAWNPRGDEVWFSGTRTNGDLRIYAVTLRGQLRDVLGGDRSLILRDIARDGRLLVASTAWRLELHALQTPPSGQTPRSGQTSGQTEERDRDLTWLELSVLDDVSPDGKQVLFIEETAAMGPDGALCIRGTDGSPVVRLGKGALAKLSPDGKWALSLVPGNPRHMILTPLGAGQPRELNTEGKNIGGMSWLPDGKRVLWFATQPGKPGQAYIQEVPDGSPHPILKEGLNPQFYPISPDGSVVPCKRAGGDWLLCPLSGADPQPLPGLARTDALRQWTADGKFLYVETKTASLSLSLNKLELATGRLQPWKQVVPSDLAGVGRNIFARITPDGQTVVYQLERTLSDLFVVEGVK